MPYTGCAGDHLQRVAAIRDARVARAGGRVLLKRHALDRFVVVPFRIESRAAERTLGAFERLQYVNYWFGAGRIRIHEANVIQINCDVGKRALEIKVVGKHEAQRPIGGQAG